MEISILRTNASHPDFLTLVEHLNAELAERDGEEHIFYTPYNSLSDIKYVVLAYAADGAVISCGAIKAFDQTSVEVKRMYTLPSFRGKGVASRILLALETWGKELSFSACILETGKRQPEAIQFYLKNGYKQMANYGPYAGVENSLCFEKNLVG